MDNSNYHQPEEHYTPDMAEEIDLPAEILADAVGIPLAKAKLVIEVLPRKPILIQQILRDAAPDWKWIIAAPIVTDMIRLLIKPSRNLNAKVWGLVFSSDLADVANGSKRDGIGSMTDEAKRLGVSRALVSNYKRTWDKLLGRYGRVFGKSPEACESNRRARIRVLNRQRKAA